MGKKFCNLETPNYYVTATFFFFLARVVYIVLMATPPIFDPKFDHKRPRYNI